MGLGQFPARKQLHINTVCACLKKFYSVRTSIDMYSVYLLHCVEYIQTDLPQVQLVLMQSASDYDLSVGCDFR